MSNACKAIKPDDRFGRLKAIRATDMHHRSCIMWLCKCDCGRDVYVSSHWLRAGIKRSCGCLQAESRHADITGQRRGKLTAVNPTGEHRDGSAVWEWRCDCGGSVFKPLKMVNERASTMCPACSMALKRKQIAAASAAIERDAEGVSVTMRQSILSGKLAANNSSGVRGVSWHKGIRRYLARITVKGRTITLGSFNTLEAAAKTRAEAAEKYFGK